MERTDTPEEENPVKVGSLWEINMHFLWRTDDSISYYNVTWS